MAAVCSVPTVREVSVGQVLGLIGTVVVSLFTGPRSILDCPSEEVGEVCRPGDTGGVRGVTKWHGRGGRGEVREEKSEWGSHEEKRTSLPASPTSDRVTVTPSHHGSHSHVTHGNMNFTEMLEIIFQMV